MPRPTTIDWENAKVFPSLPGESVSETMARGKAESERRHAARKEAARIDREATKERARIDRLQEARDVRAALSASTQEKMQEGLKAAKAAREQRRAERLTLNARSAREQLDEKISRQRAESEAKERRRTRFFELVGIMTLRDISIAAGCTVSAAQSYRDERSYPPEHVIAALEATLGDEPFATAIQSADIADLLGETGIDVSDLI